MDDKLKPLISAETVSPYPQTIEPAAFTTLAHLDRFENMLPRWQELRASGVRFADDFPHAITQRGWQSRQKTPLPILAVCSVTLTPDAITIHGQPVAPQKQIRTMMLKLIEQSITTSYVNLQVELSETLAWRDVSDVRWHVAKPRPEVDQFLPSTAYILLERKEGEAILLQSVPPFERAPINMRAARVAEREAQRNADAKLASERLYAMVLAYWQQAPERAEPTEKIDTVSATDDID